MKIATRRIAEKSFAAFVALIASALCLGSTLAGYEQVASQAVTPSTLMVASVASRL